MKTTWQEAYIQRFYRSRPGWVDGTVEFHDLCRAHIPAAGRVLELGPGGGGQTSEFLTGIAGSVTGLDVDPEARKNPFLREIHIYDGTTFPLPDNSFDAVVSDYAMEHVEDPLPVLSEIRRVLKPGGVFVFRTPNARHYVSLFSRILPDRLSRWARNRDDRHPVFPKHFRFNTRGTCRRLLQETGFDVLELRLVEKEPSYGMGSRVLFLLFLVYERFVNLSPALAGLRANLLAAARRL